VLASEGGEDALIADWVRVVGLDAMRGLRVRRHPDRPVTDADTLRLGGRTIVVTHPGAGHSAGDLMVWLPAERVLFAGDILVEDGVTMMVDGSSPELLRSLARIDSLRPAVVVPGHGALPAAAGGAGRADPRLRPRPPIRHAGGGREGSPDAARPGDAAAGGREPAGVARLAQAAKRGSGLRGGGAPVHGMDSP
jgi:glyoxylase-like metal-dependent hydrolase (beta-lactamase superfamily II)